MKLIDRLSSQLKATGVEDHEEMAKKLLIQRGQMTEKGDLTELGRQREAMGAKGRAIDRAVTRSGNYKTDYEYSAKTNRATLKKGLGIKK